MRVTSLWRRLLAVALSVQSCLAIIAFTNSGYDVQAGQPFTLTWTGGVGPITINLKRGPATNLATVQVLTSTSASTPRNSESCLIFSLL